MDTMSCIMQEPCTPLSQTRGFDIALSAAFRTRRSRSRRPPLSRTSDHPKPPANMRARSCRFTGNMPVTPRANPSSAAPAGTRVCQGPHLSRPSVPSACTRLQRPRCRPYVRLVFPGAKARSRDAHHFRQIGVETPALHVAHVVVDPNLLPLSNRHLRVDPHKYVDLSAGARAASSRNAAFACASTAKVANPIKFPAPPVAQHGSTARASPCRPWPVHACRVVAALHSRVVPRALTNGSKGNVHHV